MNSGRQIVTTTSILMRPEIEDLPLTWLSVPSKDSFHVSSYHHSLMEGRFSVPTSRAVYIDMVSDLLMRRGADQNRIAVLEREVAELQRVVGLDQPNVRKVSKATAKKEIRAYFQKNDGRTIYSDEIAGDLNLDLMQVIEVCEELEREGKIAS